jgi:hypothetical protein
MGEMTQEVGMAGSMSRMQRRLGHVGGFWAGLVGVVLMVSACSVAADSGQAGTDTRQVSGSGKTATETRQVTGFSRVELVDFGDVSIQQGKTDSLRIEADENVLPELTSDVVDGTLRLGHKPGVTVDFDNPVRYEVTLTNLTGLDLSGAGRITGRGLQVDSLDVDVRGAGLVDLSGSVDRQDVRLSGAGRYQAADLLSQVATAELSGTGEMVLAVDRQLTVKISGAGTVSYSGSASVDKSITGIGQLIKK